MRIASYANKSGSPLPTCFYHMHRLGIRANCDPAPAARAESLSELAYVHCDEAVAIAFASAPHPPPTAHQYRDEWNRALEVVTVGDGRARSQPSAAGARRTVVARRFSPHIRCRTPRSLGLNSILRRGGCRLAVSSTSPLTAHEHFPVFHHFGDGDDAALATVHNACSTM